MNNFDKLFSAVEAELKKAEVAYKNAKEASLEIARSAALSPSQAGDRFHSQGTADLTKQRYEAILALKNEIEKKKDGICVEYNGETLFLVDNPVTVSGLKIVSTKSPLGQKILNGK